MTHWNEDFKKPVRKFKVGDRVAVYDVNPYSGFGCRTTGTLKERRSDYTFEFDPDDKLACNGSWIVHVNQCRKLKRKPKEYWLFFDDLSPNIDVFDSEEEAKEWLYEGSEATVMHVREVMKRGK